MTTSDKRTVLKQIFLQNSYVKDAQKGYVVAKNFNLSIDPDILDLASRCWAEEYHLRTDLDAIVGLPDAGSRLVSLLGDMLRVTYILPSKRAVIVPGAWEDVVSYTNQSFTTNQDEVKSHIGFVKKGSKVLVVDDVVAHGNTAVAAITALQAAGVEVVGLAVLFDKAWQKGITRIQTETGVAVFSLIHIQHITQEGKIVLADT